MLDIKLIQNDFENVAQSLRKKKVDETLLEELRTISLELKSARLVESHFKQNKMQKVNSSARMLKKAKMLMPLKQSFLLIKKKLLNLPKL